jgi:hypothetical protein
MSRMHRIVFRCTAEQKSRLAQFANRFDRSESDTCRWLLAEALQQYDAETTVPSSSRDEQLTNQLWQSGAREPIVHSAANGSSVVMVLRLDVLPPGATPNDATQVEKGSTEVE